jgi:phosphate transport system protein
MAEGISDERPYEAINRLVLHLFSLVSNGLRTATTAFLTQDRDAARAIIAGDTEFDTIEDEVEELVELELAAGPSGDLRFLLAVLRIVPELERSGDLVEHIALRTAHGVASQLVPAAGELVRRMGAVGVSMWETAAKAFAERDAEAAARLRIMDDELDDLHVRLSEELVKEALAPAVAIEMGLVARFYERLGDHAVNVARRVPNTPAGTLRSAS